MLVKGVTSVLLGVKGLTAFVLHAVVPLPFLFFVNVISYLEKIFHGRQFFLSVVSTEYLW